MDAPEPASGPMAAGDVQAGAEGLGKALAVAEAGALAGGAPLG